MAYGYKKDRFYQHVLRKYASGATLEANIEGAFDSFVYGVKKQDGVVDLRVEVMRMMYSFMATMCFGKQ